MRTYTLTQGSSPLARGLRGVPSSPSFLGRIIPARAGFTSVSPVFSGSSRDHPRSRGVYFIILVSSWERPGSSPLARGLLEFHEQIVIMRRIIPARAGFTRRCKRGKRSAKDHPRSRGVYAINKLDGNQLWGSSPLARGLPDMRQMMEDDDGIIPARAGFTRRFRVVGYRPFGSSPLARGLRARMRLLCAGRRIIPARAGFTRLSLTGYFVMGDHPRSRGVYVGVSPLMGWAGGSSPLARGLLMPTVLAVDRPRIIPARAGFTATRPEGPTPPRDHPRSRGVYFQEVAGEDVGVGSSPLARGLPTSCQPPSLCDRIIPARAGFTGYE